MACDFCRPFIMGNTIQVNIPVSSTEQAEICIAALSGINFHAFQQEDDVLSAFIREEQVDEEVFNTILSRASVNYTKVIISDVNWNQKWEDEFTPVIVDSFVAVRASFHPPVNNVDYEVIITPKMSFGTGHHATTFLMMQEMKGMDFANTNVLDFGTGTGLLAILASKAGAAKVTAVDNDEWSIENARENCSVNNCDNILVIKADTIEHLGKFDFIFANINLNVIMENIPALQQASHRQTKLILSGFLHRDEKILAEALAEHHFVCNSTARRGDWVCSVWHTGLLFHGYYC